MSSDIIGAQCFKDDFVVAGDTAETLFGMCESVYRPDMEQEDLFEVLSQCLLSGVDRDCLAGWGATVWIMCAAGGARAARARATPHAEPRAIARPGLRACAPPCPRRADAQDSGRRA